MLSCNNFFPNFAETHLNHLAGLLQGIGTVSNKKGAHGKGSNNEPAQTAGSSPSTLTPVKDGR
jgi:hypothetical protein